MPGLDLHSWEYGKLMSTCSCMIFLIATSLCGVYPLRNHVLQSGLPRKAFFQIQPSLPKVGLVTLSLDPHSLSSLTTLTIELFFICLSFPFILCLESPDPNARTKPSIC